MKALVLFITSLFIFGSIQLFLLVAPPRTEKESASDILAISMDDCNYFLDLQEYGKVYRKGEKRESIVLNQLDGLPYKGNPIHQYVDPEQGLTSDFPFEEYDSYAAKLLDNVQTIIKSRQYTPYNDPTWGYQTMQYYFSISEEGLKQFTDRSYTYGLIVAYYIDDVFQEVSVLLYEAEGKPADIDAKFGKLNYEIGLSADEIITTYPEK